MGLVSTRFFELRAGNRKQATTSIAYSELHPLWRFKIRIQEVRGHHFDEIRIVWSRRPYLRRFGGSFTVPELQSLLFHKGQGKMAPEKRRPFPTKSQLSFNMFHPFSIFSCLVSFERVLNLIAMLDFEATGMGR